ncbi:MAG: DUF192 domain-containing protein [Ilumatobacteraceae bacterium]
MAWLVCDARVLASAELADTRKARRQGLLGRDHLDGALVIERCRWIHTVGMKFPIDVAYLDGDGIVVKTIQMHRFRLGIPVWRARSVIEAQAGAFGRWGLRVGDVVEVRRNDEADSVGNRRETSSDDPAAVPGPHPGVGTGSTAGSTAGTSDSVGGVDSA